MKPWFAALGLATLMALPVQAESVKLHFTAIVTSATNPLFVGDPISGTLHYDTDAPDFLGSFPALDMSTTFGGNSNFFYQPMFPEIVLDNADPLMGNDELTAI